MQISHQLSCLMNFLMKILLLTQSWTNPNLNVWNYFLAYISAASTGFKAKFSWNDPFSAMLASIKKLKPRVAQIINSMAECGDIAIDNRKKIAQIREKKTVEYVTYYIICLLLGYCMKRMCILHPCVINWQNLAVQHLHLHFSNFQENTTSTCVNVFLQNQKA